MISMEIKDTLALSASICTVLQFLAGVLVCKKYIKNGTTGDSSALTFVTCFMSCAIWLLYGLIIKDIFIIFVNLFGTLLQLCYIIIFITHTIKKKNITIKQLGATFIFILIVYIHNTLQKDVFQQDMALITKQTGFLCCSLTILFFASPLIQLAHVIRTKSTESLPFPIIIASMVVSCQWFVYGCLIDDLFIQIPNFMGCVLSGFQLCLFLIYPNKQPDQAYFI